MPYKPDTISEATELSTRDLVQFLSRELQKIGDSFLPIEQGRLNVLYVEPPKKRQGMVAYADGTQWNPGEGEGLYAFDGTTWRRLAPEEWGTFTPTVKFGGAAVGVTYGSQQGVYTRLGRIVTFRLRITLTNKGASVGAATIEGLPYASAVSYGAPQAFSANMGAANTGAPGRIIAAGTNIQVQTIAAGNTANLTDVDFTNTSDLVYSGMYHV